MSSNSENVTIQVDVKDPIKLGFFIGIGLFIASLFIGLMIMALIMLLGDAALDLPTGAIR